MSTFSVSNARQAAHGNPMDRLARVGLAARGGVYVLFGVVALLLATGNHSGEADQRGAMQTLASNTGGAILVWTTGIGLFAYALWRFAVAALGSSIESETAGPTQGVGQRGRLSAAGHQRGQDRFRRRRRQPGEAAAGLYGEGYATHRRALARRLVGIAVVVAGGVLVYNAVERKFEEYFDFGKMSSKQRESVKFLGRSARSRAA